MERTAQRLEAPSGIEPLIAVLQTAPLTFGYGASVNELFRQWNAYLDKTDSYTSDISRETCLSIDIKDPATPSGTL